ncbi:MAG: hypothetical protein HZC42_00340 [Candidatus Eisenbacteria bacterium]|nr:hypothetical protein [Candidatus Eisenbacteria bacterium]
MLELDPGETGGTVGVIPVDGSSGLKPSDVTEQLADENGHAPALLAYDVQSSNLLTIGRHRAEAGEFTVEVHRAGEAFATSLLELQPDGAGPFRRSLRVPANHAAVFSTSLGGRPCAVVVYSAVSDAESAETAFEGAAETYHGPFTTAAESYEGLALIDMQTDRPPASALGWQSYSVHLMTSNLLDLQRQAAYR